MSKTLQFRPGAVIYFQGDGADAVFLLQTGAIDLSYQDIETGQDIHEKVQGGEFFGVKSALGRYAREETAMTITETTLLALTVPEFEQIASGSTRIIFRMLKVFSTQLRRVHKQLSRLTASGAENPEEGLFRLGEYYLKNKRFREARYVCSRYLAYYPSGKFAAKVSQYLEAAELYLKKGGQASGGAEPEAARDGGPPDDAMSAFTRFARDYGPGEIIFSEYEPGGTFYMIQSGRVELVKLFGDVEKILDVIGPSEMFGEMAILESAPRSATAIALDAVKLLEFNRRNFEILMMGNPQIALRLLKIFAKRIYDSKRRFMILTLSDPQAKAADVLLMLDETTPDLDRRNESREFRITVEDIARWAGMNLAQTREIVSHFAAQRRLEISPGKVIVKNINEFSRFVNSFRKK
jgi:CRP-like cAMP-binding protein